jgi:hypothetical protein
MNEFEKWWATVTHEVFDTPHVSEVMRKMLISVHRDGARKGWNAALEAAREVLNERI